MSDLYYTTDGVNYKKPTPFSSNSLSVSTAPTVSEVMQKSLDYINEQVWRNMLCSNFGYVKTVDWSWECMIRPTKVIFNEPATIVYWTDKTKTVVKCQDGDKFDEEKGLLLCYMKKMHGNKSNFNNELRKWVKEKPEETEEIDDNFISKLAEAGKALNKLLGRGEENKNG